MKPVVVLALLQSLAVPLFAAGELRGDRELAAYFRAETLKLAERSLANVRTLGDWKAQREERRRQLQEMLGLLPMPARTDLRPVITGRLEREDFIVEKLHFQASPGLYVTANLYLPRGLDKPAPAILFECGHLRVITNGISYGNKTAYQHHGAWFAQNGYVCLVVDSLQLGEIQGVHPGTRDLNQWWWNARGYTPAGVEAWFGIRALDYLCTRPEVDTNRFGITGHSGGGAYSWTVTALDDRIKAAAPLAGLTDLQCHVVEGLMDSHCDCNFFVNIHRWDFPDLAALAAPRPLLIGNEDKDRIFPLDSVVRIHEKVKNIYQLHGAAGRLGLSIVEGGHADSPDFEVPVLRWFNRHLKGEDPPITTVAKKYFTPEQLKVFDRLPSGAVNTNVQQSFVPMAQPVLRSPSASDRKPQEQAWLKALKEKSFNGWPSGEEPLDALSAFSPERQGVRLRAVDFTSQALVRLRLYIAQPMSNASGPLILQVLDENEWRPWLAMIRAGFSDELAEELSAAGAPAADAPAWDALKRELERTRETRVWFAPRGIGLAAWTTSGRRPAQVRRRFMALGQTLDGMRVWDIRRAIQAVHYVRETGDAWTELRAGGPMAVNALYAALFEPAVVGLELNRLPRSHMEGPDYLGVLAVGDIPHALQVAGDRAEIRLR